MKLVPEPSEGDVPINEPATVTLDPGDRGTVKFTTKNRVSELILPTIAASKYPNCVYKIRADAVDRYGPATVPPTDVDDLGICFVPALKFSDSLTVEITNLGDIKRTVAVQPIGWEPSGDGE